MGDEEAQSLGINPSRVLLQIIEIIIINVLVFIVHIVYYIQYIVNYIPLDFE